MPSGKVTGSGSVSPQYLHNVEKVRSALLPPPTKLRGDNILTFLIVSVCPGGGRGPHVSITHDHSAGTSIVSDICDLSNISDIAPLTLGSMEKRFFYHLFCVTQETYLSKDLGGIYI